MKLHLLACTIVCVAVSAALVPRPAASAPVAVSAATLARGRALVVYGSCNDCHTTGWRESDGAVPTQKWMTGSAIGFRGWWGTSYPTNVRLDFQSLPESGWIAAVHTRAGHPPMVWSDLRGLPDADLRAIYQFIRSLGPAGTVMPAAVEPWRTPATRYVDMRALPTPNPP
jgi:mono/diheme cytochrome c family protein